MSRTFDKILAAFALLCVVAVSVAAQTRILVAKSRVPVSVVGEYHGGIAFPTACDQQGRFYVKPIKIGPGMVGPLFKLSSKGAVEAEFDTSGEVINRYAVRPNGGVIMFRMDGGKKVIDNFASDGTRESSVALDRPPITFFSLTTRRISLRRDPDIRLAISSRLQGIDCDLRSRRTSCEATQFGWRCGDRARDRRRRW